MDFSSFNSTNSTGNLTGHPTTSAATGRSQVEIQASTGVKAQPADHRTALLDHFRNELEKCLLLADEDRQYWLENAEKLPQVVVEGVLRVLKDKNDLIDQYLRVALGNDPEHKHLIELTTKIKNIKQTSLALEEKAQTPNADEELAQRLAQL